MLSDQLMQLLSVAAVFHCVHQDILTGHKRKLAHQMLFDYLLVDYKAVRYVHTQIQHTVAG